MNELGFNPITGEWNDSLAGDYLWSNVNFGEAMTEVMTPLTWTAVPVVLAGWQVIPGHPNAGNIGARVYLNLSAFASVSHALGKSGRELHDALEGTIFTRLPEEMEIPLIPLSKRRLLTVLPGLIRMQWRQRRAVQGLPAFLATNPDWCVRTKRQIREAATGAELARLWREEIRPYVASSVWPVLGSASHYGDQAIPLRRELTELVGPEDADALLSGVSTDTELLASLGPLVGIPRIARGEMSREAYLAQYGHRGPDEFELSVPRPAEDSSWLDWQLAQFERNPADVEGLLAARMAEFDAAWQRFESRHPRRAKSTRGCLEEVARRSRVREAARSEYARIISGNRAFALRAGELSGLADDVFFLTVDELLAVLSGEDTAAGHIPARRETHERYGALPAYPSVIRGRFDPFEWAADPLRRGDFYDSHAAVPTAADSDTVKGIAGSAGRVEGVVRRLDSAEEGDRLQPGEILVTAQTNIAWTPLFPRAAAVVTDVGAPLSHAAIVARELGIPAIVGCGDATTRLHTGDRVLVDGGQGVVRILAAE